jgi:hypothetical protein
MRLAILTLVVSFAGVLFGCGGTPVTPGLMASTQAAIRAAQEVGAERVPKAALHLRYATDQLSEAEALESDGNGERASAVLRRAEADAELALVLTRAHAEEQDAVAAEEQARELQGGR